MVLKPDQQRVCMMLKETITLLCKNGLAFKNKFTIDAVIGITLDDEDMFHVSVSEIIKSASHDSDGSLSSCELGETSQKRRKRHKVDSFKANSQGLLSDDSDGNSECGNEDSEPETSKTDTAEKEISIKGEQPEDEKQDIIFVKQELGIDWSQSQETSTSMSELQDSSNLRSVSDMNLLAASATTNYNLWTSSNLHSPQQYSQPATATITTAATNLVTAAAPDNSVHSGVDQSLMQQSVQPSTAYFCSLCNKPFKYKRSLHVHRKTHQGIYRYICPYCNKGCTSTAMLKGHIANKHTGVKEYKCSLCEEEFAYVVNLKTHMIRRHPESVSFQINPTEHFQCKQCNKTFKYKGTYLCHVAVHRGIYKYICPFCGKGCTSNAVLKGHISKHTGIKEFKCHICDYEFAYAVDLKRHLKRKHNNQM